MKFGAAIQAGSVFQKMSEQDNIPAETLWTRRQRTQARVKRDRRGRERA